MMMTSSSFTAGREPLPDDVAYAIGTCVAAMMQLRTLEMHDLYLPVIKTLADRTQPLESLNVGRSGVNWVIKCQSVLPMCTQYCTISSCVFCRLVG